MKIYSSRSGSSVFNMEEMESIPRLANDVRFRKEEFGGLVFKADNMAVFEINDLSYKLLSEVNGLLSLDSLIQFGINALGGNSGNIEIALKEMIKAEVLIL